MPAFTVTDLNGTLCLGVNSFTDLKQRLLNRVKVLNVSSGITMNSGMGYVNKYEYSGGTELFFNEMTSFLSRTTRRIGIIEIEIDEMSEGTEEMPEYLEFLSASFSVADCIRAIDCFHGEEAAACFMTGISQSNGPKKLSLDFVRSCPGVDTIEILCRGIAASVSLDDLEILDLWFRHEYNQGNQNAASLTSALRRNKSLKSFSMTITGRENFTGPILQALMEHPSLQTVKMKLDEGNILGRSTWEILRDGVCRSECAMKEIRLENFSFPNQNQGEERRALTNTSVKSLALINTEQSLPTVMGVVRLSKSLEHLDISGGYFSNDDLSELDDLLLPETATLESLCMSNCQIEEESMMEFVRKLHRMKKLKILIADFNPFTSSRVCVTAFKEALWKNTSLEFVLLAGVLPTAIAEKTNMHHTDAELGSDAEISRSEMFPLHLNRAGRGALLHNSLTASQLPKLLERAGKQQYYTLHQGDIAKDVTFWFLRHMMITQLSA